MATVDSGGVSIAYEVMGADRPGTPILFIAGLNGMRASCMKQAIPFARERPAVVHDHRGTGESGKPLGVYTVENMARDVVAILDDAGIPKAHVVGTSTGGSIAQVLCIEHPGRVQSAVICCSWSKADHFFRRQFEMRKKVLFSLGTEALIHLTSTTLNDPRFFNANYHDIVEREKGLLQRASPREVEAERIDAIIAFDQSARLGSIRTPVSIVCAKNDAVCPLYYSEQLAAAIPGAELKLYEDGGHFFYMVYADDFNNYVRSFIRKHE